MDVERPSGLLVPVTSVRTFGSPLDQPPRSDIEPNTNLAEGSVGPNVPVEGDPSAQFGAEGGWGASHVMYDAANPPPVMPWAGWPVEWDTPRWNNGTGAGARALGSDVVWAGINLNAVAAADMPVIVSKNGVKQPPPSWLTNPQPELYAHWGEFFRQIWWSYQAVGEAFLVCTSRFADNYPRTFTMVDPWLVNAEIIDGLRDYTINGVDANADVCHIRYSSWPGDARGHGPLEVAGERLLAAKALMKYGADLAANGGIPWAVLKSKFRLQKGQANELKAQWISAARSRLGAPAILDSDLDLVPLSTAPKDMALSDQQRFAEARIAILLGVPPYLLGLPTEATGMTYANINSIFDFHHRMTLSPHGNYILKAISEWALPGHVDLGLNATAYTQPSPQERAQYYEVMTRIGAMSIEEIREAEHLSPQPPPGLPSPTPAPQQVVTSNAL